MSTSQGKTTTVGYVSINNVPVELIIASGARAIEVRGTPMTQIGPGAVYMESFFDGHVQSIFDRILRGEFADLDLLVIPRSSEGYLQLYYYLEEVRRWEPEAPIPPLYLFDGLQSSAWATSNYDFTRMQALAAKLAAITGNYPSDIEEAVAARNAWRDQVRSWSEARRESGTTVSSTQFLSLLRESGADSDVWTARAWPTVIGEGVQGAGRTRLMLKGSQIDDERIYRALEEAGFQIASDDHFAGERAAGPAVEPHPSGWLWALAEHYQQSEISPRSFPQNEQDDAFLQLIDDSSTDAVLFILERNDDTLGWDFPRQKVLLEARGIPYSVIRLVDYFDPDLGAIVAAAQSIDTTTKLERV